MKKLVQLLIFSTMMFSVGRVPVFNTTYAQGSECIRPIAISQPGTIQNWFPDIGGDYVVWAGSDGNDPEIALYQISTASYVGNITDNNRYDTEPQISGDYVVWYGNDGNDLEIYLYQISTATLIGNISQNDGRDDWFPKISGDYVVWAGNDGNDQEIYLYRISTATLIGNISQNDGNEDWYPEIEGDYVVWYGEDGNDREVYLYQISTATLVGNISQNDVNPDERPQVSGDYVAWHGHDGNDFEIYLYQISTATLVGNISNNDGKNDWWVQVNGDYVVWYGSDGNDYEIYLHQISTATLIGNISNRDNLNDQDPTIYGDIVAWHGHDLNDFDIYLYQISTGNFIGRITDETTSGSFAVIDGDYIIWNGANTIYLYRLPSCNDALALFDPVTSDTGLLNFIWNNPTELAYTNTPPTNNSPEWVLGDWNGNGVRTPGYFDSGAFLFTNDIGPTTNWSDGLWLGNAGSRVAVVSGRYTNAFSNDCIGWVDSNASPVTGDLRFSLKYWCDMTASGAVALSAQWLGAPLGDSQGYIGTHQFAYGDWDNDGLDEPGIRRAGRIVRSDSAPSEGAATYPPGSAQRWDTGDGDGPGVHGLDDGLFVAGDWNGDGVDTWGVVYDDNTFYYRDVFGFNPGPFEFSSQTFTSSISTPRQVDSHHNAAGGSSVPAPASPDVLRFVEAESADTVGDFDTSRNVEAELAVSKAGNYQVGEVGLVGDSIVWTITVANTGTAPANGVQITDNVSSELRVDDALSNNGTIAIRGQSVIFTAESIGVGEAAQFQVVTTILNQPTSGTFANSVNVVLPDGNGSGSDANLVASGSVSSVDGLPATGYAPKFRW